MSATRVVPKLNNRPSISFSISSKLITVFTLIAALSFSLVFEVMFSLYQHRKESLLEDLITQKVQVIAVRLQSLLAGQRDGYWRKDEKLPKQVRSAGIVENPPKGLVTVVRQNDEILAVGWIDEQRLWFRRVGNWDVFWRDTDELSYVTDSSGNLISSNQASFGDISFNGSVEVNFKRFFYSPEVEYVFTRDSIFKRSIVASAVVAGSNLRVFSEMNVSGYLSILRSSGGRLLLLFLFVAFALFLVGDIFGSKFNDILRNILRSYDLIESGKQPAIVSTKILELSALNEQLSALAKKVYAGRSELGWTEAIESRYIALIDTFSESYQSSAVISRVGDVLFEVLNNETSVSQAELYRFFDLSETIQVQSETRLRKTTIIDAGLRREFQGWESSTDESWDVGEAFSFCSKNFAERMSPEQMRFPVTQAGKPVGFLVCRGPGVGNLPVYKGEWIILLCALIAFAETYFDET